MNIIADFETANTEGVDLKVVGSEVYARHPATEVLCLCVMFEDGDPYFTWKPGDSINLPRSMALDSSIIFEAHNAAFEQMIWKHIMVPRYELPSLPVQRWSCTMARALAHGLPGGLEPLAKVLRLPDQKDKEGADLTYGLSDPITKKAWSTPVSEGGWRPDDWAGTQKAWADSYKPILDRRPSTLARVETYCRQDCRVEWAAGKIMPKLSPYERAVWEWDQVINQRGVKVDRPFVEATIKVLQDAKAATVDRFRHLTGLDSPKQVAKLREWLAGQGVELPDLAAATVDKLLGGDDAEGPTLLPQAAHEVLTLRRLLGASAIDKFPRMLQCAGPDDRVRYTTQYHGAGTGRWAGRLFQPQNFPRLSLGIDPELAVSIFRTGDARFVEDMLGMSPILAAGKVLRHALIADTGRTYDSADYAGIEMRIVLALGGQHNKCELLATGKDVYCDMAGQIYGHEVTKADTEKRQTGKNTVLGCGFGMGWEKFRERYCGEQTDEFAQDVVKAYRESWAPKVPALWKDLDRAALEAVQHPGEVVEARCGVAYEKRTDHDWLICHLLDGQRMWYREPRICTGRFDNPAWRYRTWKEGQWKSVDAYGGLLTENVVQKLARGLLCEAIVRLENNGFPVVLTVHDEILAEPPAGSDHAAFEQIMAERPPWAVKMGVPVAVEGWQGPRYRK